MRVKVKVIERGLGCSTNKHSIHSGPPPETGVLLLQIFEWNDPFISCGFGYKDPLLIHFEDRESCDHFRNSIKSERSESSSENCLCVEVELADNKSKIPKNKFCIILRNHD